MTALATAWVIRHIAFEDLGSFSATLIAHGYQVCYLEAGVDSLTPLKNAGEQDILCVLGGPISVYDTAHYPWLVDELAAIRSWLDSDRSTLGICLGAQLIAAALGARVYPGHTQEIGWFPLQITQAGMNSPVRFLDAAHTNILHWHGDTFDLPEGATLLASSQQFPNQIFSRGSQVLAFQCHPEFDASRIEQWLIANGGALHGHGIDLDTLRQQGADHGTALKQQAQACLHDWLTRVGA